MTITVSGQLTWTFTEPEEYEAALLDIQQQSIYTAVQADPESLTIQVTFDDSE